MKRCLHFDRCSQNLCPLDIELKLRSGGEADKCRWMRERRVQHRKVVFGDGRGHEFKTTGGSVMPDDLLKFVPIKNIARLNKPSQKSYEKLETRLAEKEN